MATAASFADERIALGAAPIDGGAGGDVRGEAEFENLEALVRQMDTGGPGAVPWREVARGGLSIIETKSKDLLVGVWIAFALSLNEGIAGLAVGLGILEGMIEQHWQDLQPPARRERARVGALEWLVGRLSPIAEKWPNPPETYLAAVAAFRALDSIDRMLSEKLTKEQASLGELIRALRPRADEARRAIAEAAAAADRAAEQVTAQPQPPEPSAPAAVTPIAPAPAATVSVPPPPVAPSAVGADINRSVSQLTDAIRAHALALRQSDLADPRGYLLTRVGMWLGIRQAPPGQAGKSALPPPDPARLQPIDLLQTSGRHSDAILALESIVASSPFFIDGNMAVARSLAVMGPGFAQARTAVATSTAAFLLRIPELRDVGFSDGRPFVSEAAIKWLEQEGALGGGGTATVTGDDPVIAVAAEARRIASEGKPREAVALLAEALTSAGGGRKRMRVQLTQAQILIELDMPAAAWSLLDHLDVEIGRRMIEEWEPELAASVAEMRMRIGTQPALMKLVPDERRRVALEDARTRLARCDIAAAVRLLS